MGWFTRSIRPTDDIVPNPNDPLANPPASVGPDQLVNPGDPDGIRLTGDDPPAWVPPRIVPSAWSGWPEDWQTPWWGGGFKRLVDIAWICVDINSSSLAAMPPYLVGASQYLPADWLNNPDPDLYTSWDEFLKQAAWDYQC